MTKRTANAIAAQLRKATYKLEADGEPTKPQLDEVAKLTANALSRLLNDGGEP